MVLPPRCGPHGVREGRIQTCYDIDFTSQGRLPGSGHFSTAYSVTLKGSQETRLIRAVSKQRCVSMYLRPELEALRSLDHSHLSRIYELWEDPNFFYIVMENVKGKDLLSVAEMPGRKLSEALVAAILRQVLQGLQHMHGRGLVHEDIRPENILILDHPSSASSNSCSGLTVRIIDYGLAEKHTEGGPKLPYIRCCHCASPEQSVVQASSGPRMPGAQAAWDIWAVGAICFLLISGRALFEGSGMLSSSRVLERIKSGQWDFLPVESFADVSDCAKAFISKMLTRDPEARPDATQGLGLPFMQVETLPKSAHRPLAKFKEVQIALRHMSAANHLRKAAVNATAECLSASQIVELRYIFESMDKSNDGVLRFNDVRRGLIHAGVQLPGECLDSLNIIEQGRNEFGPAIMDYGGLCGAALARRRFGLEEPSAWLAWCKVVPEGNTTVSPSELPKVLDQADKSLQEAYGQAASDANELAGPAEGPLPDHVNFEEFLDRIRRAGQRWAERHRAATKMPGRLKIPDS